MRRASILALAAALIALPATVGAQTDQDAAAVPPPSSQTSGEPPTERLLSPEEQGRQGLVKGVAEQPIRDLNLMQSRIPVVLQLAVLDAYARPSPATCEGITAEVERLNEALGADLDEPVSTDHPSTLTRGKTDATKMSYDAMRSGLQSAIPYDGYIRIVSGAARHDKRVMAAIQAGAIRRAYLKGMGEAKGCLPPATPRHLAHPVSIASGGNAH
jgi:hypothetical protein